MDRFLRIITPEVQSLVDDKRTSEAIYALEETISWSLVQLALIWCDNFINLSKSEECLRAAIKTSPGKWEFHVNLAHVLNLACKYQEAKEEALKSIELSYGQVCEAYYNLGVILVNMCDHEGAISAYKSALNLYGDKPNLAAYNIAASYLAVGKWSEGWNAYESRFTSFQKIKDIHDRFKQHYEKGKPSKDKTIYLYSEQGVGDIIQFARYLPKFRRYTGAKLILEPQVAVAKLMEDNFKLDCIVPRNNGEWPEISEDVDYAFSINSLPGFFEAGDRSIPNKPYIKAPNREMPDILKTDNFKVGICWAGNADHLNDIKRSIPLKYFNPLFNMEGIQLYSLQKDSVATRNWWGKSVNLLADVPPHNIIDLSNLFHDFTDTAYYISQMDLIVTVDTSVAHLAGAMGKSTWLLIDKHNDWRWGLVGDKTLWYPSVRIFRQETLFAWQPVLEQVAKELVSCRIQQQGQKKSHSCDKKGLLKRRSRKHLR